MGKLAILEMVLFDEPSNKQSVIVRECGQTLGLGLVDRNRTVGNY